VIKRISLVRRREGMTREEFAAHWMGPHAEIVKQLPGLRGLRFGLVRSWTPPEAAWDGVGELWFDSIDDAHAAFATEPYASWLAEDRPRFSSELQNCFVEEHTAVPPPPY
jgi:uncharacterized protein (TIGR02118 family)